MRADRRRRVFLPTTISVAIALLATPAQAIDGVCVRFCGGGGWLDWAIWAGVVAAQILANQANTSQSQHPTPRQPPPHLQARSGVPVVQTSQRMPSASRPVARTAKRSPSPNWADCHASGGVWGHNGSCGHPVINTPAPQTAAAPAVPPRPELYAQPPLQWTELRLPASIPAPQSSPESAMSPPPPPNAARGSANANNCIGAPAGTAIFEKTSNPDRPSLECGPATQPPTEDAAWTELTAKQLYAYQTNKSPTDISQFPQVADRGGLPDVESGDRILSKKMMYRDCLRLRVSENSTSATLENRCNVTLRYSVCFINYSGGINPMTKVGSPEIGPAIGEGALPESAVDHDELGRYFKLDDDSGRFVLKRPVSSPGVIDDVPTIRSYQGVKLRAEPGYGPRTAELDCSADGGPRGDIESITARNAGRFRRAGAPSGACESIAWRLNTTVDSDLLSKPLNTTVDSDLLRNLPDVAQKACTDSTNKNCILLNQLVSSIPVPEFKRFVKSTINFSMRRYPEPGFSSGPISAACRSREYPNPSQCLVSIRPEFWKIPDTARQELLLILETGKIQSMLNRGKLPNYVQPRQATPAHLKCLSGSELSLGDYADDSQVGLNVIGAIPITSRQ